MRSVTCPYCGELAARVRGDRLYAPSPPYGAERRWFWRCAPCDATVGCHPKGPGETGDRPLGSLANLALRRARQRAHEAFDPMWQSGAMTRKQAYRWLASRLGLTEEECHIGQFDVVRCAQVVATCHPLTQKVSDVG